MFVFFLILERMVSNTERIFNSDLLMKCSRKSFKCLEKFYSMDPEINPPPFGHLRAKIVNYTYIHTYIRLLTTSPKGLFSANYKEKDKNKNIYKLFKVTIANH